MPDSLARQMEAAHRGDRFHALRENLASVSLDEWSARPAAFRETLESLGAEVIAERTFPDHHIFSAADVAGLAAEADLWVTTEKDAGKIPPGWVGDADVRVLVLGTEVIDDGAFLDWLEGKLRVRPHGHDSTIR